jgi:hypothetical protein
MAGEKLAHRQPPASSLLQLADGQRPAAAGNDNAVAVDGQNGAKFATSVHRPRLPDLYSLPAENCLGTRRGENARTWRSMSAAGRDQSMSDSAFSILCA